MEVEGLNREDNMVLEPIGEMQGSILGENFVEGNSKPDYEYQTNVL